MRGVSEILRALTHSVAGRARSYNGLLCAARQGGGGLLLWNQCLMYWALTYGL